MPRRSSRKRDARSRGRDADNDQCLDCVNDRTRISSYSSATQMRSDHRSKAAKRGRPLRHSRSRSTSRRREKRARYRSPTSCSHDSIDRFAEVMAALVRNNAQETSKTAVRGEVIPPFNPEEHEQNAETWCFKVNELRNIFHWSEDMTIYFALSKLRGLAEVWYRSLPTLKFNWTEWKNKIITAFPSKRDYYEMLEEMMRRKKRFEETYAKYYYEKLALLNICKIQGSEAVSCIIGGIEDRIVKTGAKAGNYITPEELFKYLNTLNPPQGSNQTSRMPPPRGGSTRKDKQGQNRDKKTKTDIICYSCGQVGHKAGECNKEKNIKRCTYCRRPGHSEEDCFKKKKANENTKTVA